jgi:hypothetical protein
MKRQQLDPTMPGAERTSLRRRIKSLYQRLNRGDLDRCYLHVDPRLRVDERISFTAYASSLEAFRSHYGLIDIWHIRINLYLDVVSNKYDDRPFAYVYIFWQDERKGFHVFRERWVKEAGRWYTRVVGLVTHQKSNTTKE